jgi:hypothetical protein
MVPFPILALGAQRQEIQPQIAQIRVLLGLLLLLLNLLLL